ncbi:MAG: phosphatase PAP2 family protein [Bacteroidia bacterium]|nr:phosphatase PAP2 family protein [Bacteroidia bacterium]
MIEKLISLDKKIFLALNHFAAPGLDPVMRFLSGPVPWLIFLIAFLIILWKKPWLQYRKRYLIMLGSMILAYVISEQSSVHLFKEVFLRLRPCHEPSLAGQVRLVANHCGGQFGFVSTHAANSFNLALLSALLIHRRWFTISVFAWAVVVSYSRIYLGVHYPGDILGGMVLGLLIGTASFGVARKLLSREQRKDG